MDDLGGGAGLARRGATLVMATRAPVIPTTPRGRPIVTWRVRTALVLVAASSFALSLLVGARVFPHLSINNDEPVYVLEAQLFREGALTLPPTHDGPFRPWMSGRVDGGRLVLVSQPVLPALLAASDLLFGSMRVGLGLIAAGAVLAVFAAVRRLVDDPRVALVAAGLFAWSPLVVVQSALFVSYVLAVALAGAVIALVGRALEDGAPVGAALGGGAVGGVLFFTRPIEALMLGAALLCWAVASGVRGRRLLRLTAGAALAALPIVVLCLAFNRATTGSALRFPLWSIGGNDAFGFGVRTIVEGGVPITFGPSHAARALIANLGAFPHWLLGGLATIPLAAWGAHRLRRTRPPAAVLLLAITLIYPAGYFFYYGTYLVASGRRYFGPHYYLGLLIPATALIAVGLVELWDRRRAWVWPVVAALVLATAIEVPAKAAPNLRTRDDIGREVAAIDRAVERPAVVIVPAGRDGPFVLHPRGALGNPPSLDAPVLYAADLGPANHALFDRFPGRAIYRLQMVRAAGRVVPDVTRLGRVRRRSVIARLTVDPAGARSSPEAYVDVAGASARCTPADPAAGVTVLVDAARVRLDGCAGAGGEVPLPAGGASVAVGVRALGPAGPEEVEQRLWVRTVDGLVDVATPPDLWRRVAPSTRFLVVAPSEAPWFRASLTADPEVPTGVVAATTFAGATP